MNSTPSQIPRAERGMITGRQRNQPANPRVKAQHDCVFMGKRCEYMMEKPDNVFKNAAELKEDALRHLNGFQCCRCGRRFGKRYGLVRHGKKGNRCVQVDKSGAVFLSAAFKEALRELEAVKKRDGVVAAFEKCRELLGHQGPGLPRRESKRRTQGLIPPENSAQDALPPTRELASMNLGSPYEFGDEPRQQRQPLLEANESFPSGSHEPGMLQSAANSEFGMDLWTGSEDNSFYISMPVRDCDVEEAESRCIETMAPSSPEHQSFPTHYSPPDNAFLTNILSAESSANLAILGGTHQSITPYVHPYLGHYSNTEGGATPSAYMGQPVASLQEPISGEDYWAEMSD